MYFINSNTDIATFLSLISKFLPFLGSSFVCFYASIRIYLYTFYSSSSFGEIIFESLIL